MLKIQLCITGANYIFKNIKKVIFTKAYCNNISVLLINCIFDQIRTKDTSFKNIKHIIFLHVCIKTILLLYVTHTKQ